VGCMKRIDLDEILYDVLRKKLSPIIKEEAEKAAEEVKRRVYAESGEIAYEFQKIFQVESYEHTLLIKITKEAIDNAFD